MYGSVVAKGNERRYAGENCFFHFKGKETLSRPVREAEIPGPTAVPFIPIWTACILLNKSSYLRPLRAFKTRAKEPRKVA